jgi:glycosyltransferase involved in cell wall biosynthesis
MSFDCMIVARLAGIKRGFYEVGDLRQAEGAGRFFSFLEKQCIKNLDALILTSKFFYDNFYINKISFDYNNIYIIDNKVSSYFQGKRPNYQYKVISNRKIRIGLIGLLLKFAKENNDKYSIECFGDGPFRYLIESSNFDNIRYHGSFKNPDELKKIYSKVDLNFVVYDSTSKNVQLAIPNKLFESAFFGVPILCCDNTSVGEMAVDMKIGKTISLSSFSKFESGMKSIDINWINEHSAACFKFDEDYLIDDGEKVVMSMIKNTILNQCGLAPATQLSRRDDGPLIK